MGREQVSMVIYDMSMSLDGFVTAAEISPEEPLGIGGERLHEWAFPGTDPRGISLLEQSVQSEGAIIVGRRTYDASLPWWGTNGPTGETRTPVFVLTHRESPPPLDGGVYTFVTDGIDSVVEQAKAVAGDKNVGVSGVSVGQQLIEAATSTRSGSTSYRSCSAAAPASMNRPEATTVSSTSSKRFRHRTPRICTIACGNSRKVQQWESSSSATPSPSTAPSSRPRQTPG
jgi:dihydrofolate reductase